MTQEEYGTAYQAGFIRTVRLLQCRGATSHLAEDVAQAAWLQGWRKLDQLRDQSMLGGWVNTIAINIYRRAGQKEARYLPLLEFELMGAPGIDSAPLDVEKILKTCRARDRTLFEQQLHGWSTQEIANQRGVSPTAMRIRLLRARRAARARLEDGAVPLQEYFQSRAAVA